MRSKLLVVGDDIVAVCDVDSPHVTNGAVEVIIDEIPEPIGIYRSRKFIDGQVVYEYVQHVVTKQQLVSEIIVTTTTGKVFDGDELSQDRMLRALAIADLNGQTETQWKMADNSVQTVTREDLKEALTLAGLAMSEIWINN